MREAADEKDSESSQDIVSQVQKMRKQMDGSKIKEEKSESEWLTDSNADPESSERRNMKEATSDNNSS